MTITAAPQRASVLLAAALLLVVGGVVLLVALRPAERGAAAAEPSALVTTDSQPARVATAPFVAARTEQAAGLGTELDNSRVQAASNQPRRSTRSGDKMLSHCLRGNVILPQRVLDAGKLRLDAIQVEGGKLVRSSALDEFGGFSMQFESGAPVRLLLMGTVEGIAELGTETPIDCQTSGQLQLDASAQVEVSRLVVLGSDGQPAKGAWMVRADRLEGVAPPCYVPTSSRLDLRPTVGPTGETDVTHSANASTSIAVGAAGHSTRLVVLSGGEQVVQLPPAKRIRVRMVGTAAAELATVRNVGLETEMGQSVLCESVPVNSDGEAELVVEVEFPSQLVATLLVRMPSGQWDTMFGHLVPTQGALLLDVPGLADDSVVDVELSQTTLDQLARMRNRPQ
ncbi:MAG: hypothetical protein GC161_01365 [Planctomycetaceae bacterium]|nr:hypothetical protein [Planctomycetaceae bacterium]